jgi:hypothetical protein
MLEPLGNRCDYLTLGPGQEGESMADGWRDEPEASKTDTAASDACTKSGAFALALTVVLAILAASWANKPVEDALAKYILYRDELSSGVQRLLSDPLWARYQTVHSLTDSTTLANLPTMNDLFSVQNLPVSTPPAPPNAPIPQHKRPTTIPEPFVLHAPTGFYVTRVYGLSDAEEITQALKALNDPLLLWRSRQYSNYFDHSIARWDQRRSDLITNNEHLRACKDQKGEMPSTKQEGPSIKLDDNFMLGCLTVGDVGTLAQYEFPAITNPDQIGGHLSRDIDIVPGGIPHDPFKASIVTEAALLLTLVYFWAYTNVTVASAGFPVAGTLFGAFSKSRFMRESLITAIWLPAVCSLFVAFESANGWLTSGCVLLSLVSLQISLTLHRSKKF